MNTVCYIRGPIALSSGPSQRELLRNIFLWIRVQVLLKSDIILFRTRLDSPGPPFLILNNHYYVQASKNPSHMRRLNPSNSSNPSLSTCLTLQTLSSLTNYHNGTHLTDHPPAASTSMFSLLQARSSHIDIHGHRIVV